MVCIHRGGFNHVITIPLECNAKRVQLTFLKPMSLAYSLKHWRQMFNAYLRIKPCLLEQARLKLNRKHILISQIVRTLHWISWFGWWVESVVNMANWICVVMSTCTEWWVGKFTEKTKLNAEKWWNVYDKMENGSFGIEFLTSISSLGRIFGDESTKR